MTASNPQPRARLAVNMQIALEAVGGVVLGFLLALFGGRAGSLFADSSNGWGDLVGAILGALLGYVLGAPLGIIGVALLLRRQGSMLLSVVGSVLGAVLVLLLAEPLRLNQQSNLLMVLFGVTVLAGSLVGYHARARRRNIPGA